MPSGTYIGTPCVKAGHTLRYTGSRNCVVCKRLDSRTRYANDPVTARAQHTAWCAKNPEKARAIKVRWSARNPDKVRANEARNRGRCPEADRKARREHDGACAVCGTADPGSRGWQIDHPHDGSGDVRGVLCMHCNSGLGFFKDSAASLRRAIEYIERPAAYPATKK